MDDQARWTLLEQVFQAALALEPAARDDYVRTACGADEELRRRVLSLLGHDAFASSNDTEMWSEAAAPRIGPYQVLSKLGSGGMGDVYLVQDTRLGRRVALKVLAPQFAADPERKRRFLREAKAASALSHPNIVTIHDFGTDGKIDYLVMEYVPGKPLDRVIPPDGLRLKTALGYASQIAQALACAHAAGIIHRDLKPANVIITETGAAKVLDFGVAKLTAPEGTQTETREGAIIGTPVYMSPEQAEGKPVDVRSDVFSFGSLLYEMVTGRRAFQRDSAASILSAILKENPPPANQVIEDVPAPVVELIQRCLRKAPADRFQTIAEVIPALKTVTTASLQPGRTRRWVMFGAAAAVLLVMAVILTWRFGPRLTRDSTDSASSAGSLTPVPLTSDSGFEFSPSFSPDGNHVAFSWQPALTYSNSDIYVKAIGSNERVQLTRDPAAEGSPAWSPDGRYVAFLRVLRPGQVGLFLVPPIGGRERRISEVRGKPDDGIAWFPDSKRLVVVDRLSPNDPPALFVLSLETGEKYKLTSPPQMSRGDALPAISPDGGAVVFSRFGASEMMCGDFYYLELSKDFRPSGEPKRLTFMNGWAWGSAWTPDGKAVVVSAGAPHSLRLWRITQPGATAQTIQLEPLEFAGVDAGSPAISHQARMSYVHLRLDVDVWRLELKGGRPVDNPPSRLISSTRIEHDAHYSPDGSRIAFASNRTGSNEIWVCDSDGANATPLTSFAGPYYTAGPRWSPDGHFIAFLSQKEEQDAIYIIASDAGRPKHMKTEIETGGFEGWSRNGKWLYFKSNQAGGQLWKMPSGGGAAIQVIQKDYLGLGSALESRDGKFLYYLKENLDGQAGGLWKRSLESGEEAQVLPSILNDNFAVVSNGIYFVSEVEQLAIQFLNFGTGRISTITKIPREADYGFDVSPDERWLIYAQDESRGSDLMLVENFR